MENPEISLTTHSEKTAFSSQQRSCTIKSCTVDVDTSCVKQFTLSYTLVSELSYVEIGSVIAAVMNLIYGDL
jgi:hypothetical protein